MQCVRINEYNSQLVPLLGIRGGKVMRRGGGHGGRSGEVERWCGGVAGSPYSFLESLVALSVLLAVVCNFPGGAIFEGLFLVRAYAVNQPENLSGPGMLVQWSPRCAGCSV